MSSLVLNQPETLVFHQSSSGKVFSVIVMDNPTSKKIAFKAWTGAH